MFPFLSAQFARLPRLVAGVTAAVWITTASAEPIISEFVAANTSGLVNEDGGYSDWIEIHNPDAAAISLNGWYLTDNATRKTKWAFPAVTVPAKGYVVVFASGKDRRETSSALHTNFSLNAEGEYLALVRPDGMSTATELAPEYPAQYPDISYGLGRTTGGLAATMSFLRQPTPGAENAEADKPPLGSMVQFSRAAGLFSAPFVLSLSGASADEQIRYVAVPMTSQGAAPALEPNAESPGYTGPLQITDSVIIRAAVFSADDQKRGPSTVVHYLKLANSGSARADLFTSALPVVVVGTHGYGDLEENGTRYPGWAHVFTAGGGTPAFAAPPVVSSPALLRIRGNSSSSFPKKGYSLNLDDGLGDGNPESLLGMSRSDEWALISPWNYDRTYVHNAYVYALSHSLGRWAPQTRFVEVFFDGDGKLDATDYAGISLLTERMNVDADRIDITPLSPNDVSGDAITGGYLLKIDVPDADEWSFLTKRGIPDLDSAAVIVAEPKAAKLPQAQRDYIRGYVQGMEDALFAGQASGWSDRSYLDYIDVDSWVDHHLLEVFSGNIDGLSHSDYFHKDRGGKLAAGPVWDFDRALGSYDERTRNWDSWNGGPVDVWKYGWYGVIATDPEFRQAWVDRWQSLRQDEFSTETLGGLVDSLAASVTPEAAARDSARWPDNISPTGRGFAGEIERLKNWVTQRSAWIDRQFVVPPTKIENGSTVVFAAPAGAKLAYTLDGSDPRSLGGDIAPNAQLVAGPLTLPATSNVHVRSYKAEWKDVFPGSPWSSAVGGASSSPLLPKARLINISTRGTVGAGANALIAGVVVADTGGKRYLARAVGPGLTAFGAAGAVVDPQLSIFSSEGVEIYRNNGWQNGPDSALMPAYAKSVGAFPLAPGSADSALANELGRGLYTVQITTPSQQPGIGLAELYELDGNGRTVNLSTRAQVRTGDGVLIGGFVVQGPAYKRMLIRAVGPTLGAFGVSAALMDPILTIYSGQTVVASNDRWSEGESSAVVATAGKSVGAFALAEGSEDAALLITLPPGAFTIEVRGKNNTEGVALLEIYDLP
ncbi:MAG: CotH kinase family protein [Opitutaceae bacterium]|nr:CotH kinase family protein [Opitutaceae bacterium]